METLLIKVFILCMLIIVLFGGYYIKNDPCCPTCDCDLHARMIKQNVEVVMAYQCDNSICFGLKAANANEYSIGMNGTSYYINSVPMAAATWEGEAGGVDCTNAARLAPGETCYGMISETLCKSGAVFKVSLPWGISISKGITGCIE